MKKTTLLLTLIAVGIFGQSLLAQKSGYEINVNMEGAEGITFRLQERAHGRFVTIDSAMVVNGKFKIEGTAICPSLVVLVDRSNKKGFSFFVENTKINIRAKYDSLNNAKVTGSKTQDEFNVLLANLKPYQEKSLDQYKMFQAASQARDTAKMKEISTQAKLLSSELTKIQKDFVKQNPKSFVSPVIISGLVNVMPRAEIESMINSLDRSVAQAPEIVEMKAKFNAMKSADIGQKAPDFTLNDPNGVPVSLSSKLGKRLLLVDFWAAWCGPCRKENPSVVKVYKEFNQKGFDVLGVSLDRTREDWIKAIADDNLAWTQVSDLAYFNCAAAKLYFVNSIPSNVLLDKNGIIVAKNLRGEELYNKVKEILGSK